MKVSPPALGPDTLGLPGLAGVLSVRLENVFMQPLLYRAPVNIASRELLQQTALEPGHPITLSTTAERQVVVYAMSRARWFGLAKQRPVLLGCLEERDAREVLSSLGKGARLRARVVDLEGAAFAPTGMAISVWTSEDAATG